MGFEGGILLEYRKLHQIVMLSDLSGNQLLIFE